MLLDVAALLDELDQRARLADVLEVGRHHRVERLLDQPFHVAEALDHQGRLAVVDVHDHRQRQRWLEGVLGDQRDLRQVLVVVVRADLASDPLQDDVGRRDGHDLAGVGVERVLARHERHVPHAAMASLHQLAMPVLLARQVRAGLAGVEDHHADGADFDDGLGDHLHRGKQPVEIVRAFDQYLQLAPPQAAGLQEPVRRLEVVVVRLHVGWDRRPRWAR